MKRAIGIIGITVFSLFLIVFSVNAADVGGKQTVFVDQLTNGILDPNLPMLGPVRDGGHIVANTSPGCWGPMITPEIRGGHEVARPVAVAGAEVGDAIAIRIQDITVTSVATSSGNDRVLQGRFLGDPYVAAKCSGCGALYQKTVVKGIGQEAIRCAKCGADATPFNFTNGFTIAFDDNRSVGVTMNREAAERIAKDAKSYAALPENSVNMPLLPIRARSAALMVTWTLTLCGPELFWSVRSRCPAAGSMRVICTPSKAMVKSQVIPPMFQGQSPCRFT